MFLGLSILILIAQPYKKSYMNVLDGLLLALLGLVHRRRKILKVGGLKI